jgi:hypothetical protein
VGCDAKTSCDGSIAASETAAEKAHWRIVRTRIQDGREHVEYTCDVCLAAVAERPASAPVLDAADR